MKKAFRTLIPAMAAVLVAASCAEVLPETAGPGPQDGRACLTVSDVTAAELTRSVVRGTSFPTDKDVSIGIFVCETSGHIGSAGTTEYDCLYENVRFTRPAGQTEWVPEKEIRLSTDTLCVVYAYYPWKEGTGWDHINIYPSVDGDDWMWATPVNDVSAANPGIKLTMSHALSLVEITFNVSNYSEGTLLDSLMVSSDGAAEFSSFNFRNGTHFTDGNGRMTGKNALAAEVGYPLTDGVIRADCLLVPYQISSARQDMTISCTLGGKKYTAGISGSNGVIIQQGVKSTVSLNIKGSTMAVESVGVGEWSSTGVRGSAATVDGHNVTVNSDVPCTLSIVNAAILNDDIFSQILEVRYDKSAFVDGGFEFTYEKTGSCMVSHDAAAGMLSVADVTSDVTIRIRKTSRQ